MCPSTQTLRLQLTRDHNIRKYYGETHQDGELHSITVNCIGWKGMSLRAGVIRSLAKKKCLTAPAKKNKKKLLNLFDHVTVNKHIFF